MQQKISMNSDDMNFSSKRHPAIELSTPSTITFFVVVGVSGIMLLFKIGSGVVKEAHEWLGLAFVIVAGVHVFRHWRAMKSCFATRAFWGTSLIVGAITLAFIIPSATTGGGNPMSAVVKAVVASPIEWVAPVFGSTPQDLMAKLEKAGIKVEGPTQTLEDIANKSGRHLPEIINLVVPEPKPH